MNDTQAVEVDRDIGWRGTGYSVLDCERTNNSLNAQEITSEAAIILMGLLIHDLENVSLDGVLEIGNGGDYSITLDNRGDVTQVEVSGIRKGTATQSNGRLQEKSAQVLTHSPHGYASVTTFLQTPKGIVHSFLHFVELNERSRKQPSQALRRKSQ